MKEEYNRQQDPNFYIASFPQPIVVGYGYVKSDGTKDSNRMFHDQSWTVTKMGVGWFRIKHNIGDLRYLPVLTAVSTGPFRFINVANLAVSTFDAYLGNQAGTAFDFDFQFIVYKNF
jgi:hypothetical protein